MRNVCVLRAVVNWSGECSQVDLKKGQRVKLVQLKLLFMHMGTIFGTRKYNIEGSVFAAQEI